MTEAEVAAILQYWTQPTGVATAPPGLIELARIHIGMLAAALADTERKLEDANITIRTLVGEPDPGRKR